MAAGRRNKGKKYPYQQLSVERMCSDGPLRDWVRWFHFINQFSPGKFEILDQIYTTDKNNMPISL